MANTPNSAIVQGAAPVAAKGSSLDDDEALHPETKHGSVGRNHPKSQSRKVCDSDRFTRDTARKTGRSERAIQRNVNATPGEPRDGGRP